MKKILLVVLAALVIGLSGCDQLFSELEITFFNMKRIGNVQMDITMDTIPDEDPISFTVITDGFHHVTSDNEEVKYTYLNQDKQMYRLVLIDDHYDSYQIETLGDYHLDTSVILELFLLAPQDFKLDSDGYYRPIVILYDFTDLEFKVVEGYITEMNFNFNIDDNFVPVQILFSNVNNSEFNFPVYHEYTELEQSKYFLELDNNIITETELGFDVTIDEIIVYYTSPNDYLVIDNNGSISYYYVSTSSIKDDLEDLVEIPVEQYISFGINSSLNTINFDQLNIYFNEYLLSKVEILTEDTLEVVPDDIEQEDNN